MKIEFKYKIALFILNLLSKTWRIKILGKEPTNSGIVAFWHGYMLPVWKYFAKYKPVAVVSQSKDGELLSNLLSYWGYSLIRGSSSKGGKIVLEEIINRAKNDIILMTPDGPKGPIYEFKAGAVIASQRSNSILYLCKVEMNCRFIFKKSWDKFSLPLPFSKVILQIIEIGTIPNHYDREEIDKLIKECQDILNSK